MKKLGWFGVSAAVLFVFGIGGCKVTHTKHSSPEPEAKVTVNKVQAPHWVKIRDSAVARHADHKHRADCGHVKLGSWWYVYRGSP